MKKLNYSRLFAIVLVLICTCSIAIAGGGRGLKYNPHLPEDGGGTPPPPPAPKKTCSEKYKNYSFDFLINELHLRYDLTGELSIDEGDLIQLRAAHGGFFERKGEIRDLMAIVQGNDYGFDSSRKPICRVTVTGTDCTGNVIKNYSSVNDVMGNLVRGVPDFGLQLQAMKIEIKTIKTTGHELQLGWEASLDQKQIAGYVVIDKNATIKCTRTAYFIIGPRHNLLPVRKRLDDGVVVFDPVENCIRDFELRDDAEYQVVEPPISISPTLEKKIYTDGGFEEKVKWSEPTLIKQTI